MCWPCLEQVTYVAAEIPFALTGPVPTWVTFKVQRDSGELRNYFFLYNSEGMKFPTKGDRCSIDWQWIVIAGDSRAGPIHNELRPVVDRLECGGTIFLE